MPSPVRVDGLLAVIVSQPWMTMLDSYAAAVLWLEARGGSHKVGCQSDDHDAVVVSLGDLSRVALFPAGLSAEEYERAFEGAFLVACNRISKASARI